jgi:surface antigen
VTGLVPGSLARRACYRARPRPWHPALRRLSAGIFLCALSLAGGGCSFSYQLDNLVARKDSGSADPTGSLRPTARATSELPAEADLAIARAAVSEVFTKGGKDTSVPWENPQTGARGTITPLTSADNQAGACRDFLASYLKDGSESWLQGEACRIERGKWEVRSLRPWKKG